MIASDKGGHLVTITDLAEKTFIYNNLRQTEWGSWIGLRSTGTPGNFAWVTGEPFSYSNWNRNEPNNQGGSSTFVAEPFIHIMGYDFLNRWNDMPNFHIPFIAEFDMPLLTYTQISGPTMGSRQAPGVYVICYERLNSGTGMKDTCCFTITVKCEGNDGNTVINNRRSNPAPEVVGAGNFNATVFPNPTTSMFTVKVESNNNAEKINLRVMDIYGRVIEMKNGVAPNTMIRFGNGYKPGVYFTQILQGDRKLTLKLVKE
jgi:hypothetical protein